MESVLIPFFLLGLDQNFLHLLIVTEDVPGKLQHVLKGLPNRTPNHVHHLMLGNTGIRALIVRIQV